jgi:hypothetical protein
LLFSHNLTRTRHPLPKLAHPTGIGPLALHAVDRCIRLYRGRRACTLVSATQLPAGGGRVLTELCVRAPLVAQSTTGDSNVQSHEAGDYCFVCVPAVSALEWHPFSISSAPVAAAAAAEGALISFHILAAGGADSFTSRLAAWAAAQSSSAGAGSGALCSVDSQVLVDGPYGRISLRGWKTAYSALVLCAGGVGVTPLASALGELLALHAAGRLAHCRAVHLVWVVGGDAAPFRRWFPALLAAAHAAGAPFHLHLHATGSSKAGAGAGAGGAEDVEAPALAMTAVSVDASAAALPPVIKGRPNYPHIFESIVTLLGDGGAGGNRVGVLSCGPQSMVDAVRCAASQRGFDQHEECFLL